MRVNGYFGEIAVRIAKTHKRNVLLLEKDYGEPITLEAVEGALEKNKDIISFSQPRPLPDRF